MLAARITDMHVCPMVTGIIPHIGGPIVAPSSPMILIGNMPVAGLGSLCTCVGPPDTILRGSFTVLGGNRPIARLGDNTAHGGFVVSGFPTVLIGG